MQVFHLVISAVNGSAELAAKLKGWVEFMLTLAGIGAFILAVAWVLRSAPRSKGLHWSIPAIFLSPLPVIVFIINHMVGGILLAAIALGIGAAIVSHNREIGSGGDIARAALMRVGVGDLFRQRRIRRHSEEVGWIWNGRLNVGSDSRDLPIWIPAGGLEGRHTLIPGATGSGKSITAAWITGKVIETGHGGVVIDPKGDEFLRRELERVAQQRNVRFLDWSFQGPCVYNPYQHGNYSEIAEKALAGEQFTEPHYLRQAQRYLAHAVATMRAAEIEVTPVTLMQHMDPGRLEASSRSIPERDATAVQAYLDSLSDRQKRELAGVRDRLSILAESQARNWIDPITEPFVAGPPLIDLEENIARGEVVYFRLEADRMPLLSQMLAAAVITDLVTISAKLQSKPIPTAVLIEEFSALTGEQVARLFGRGRGAGFSLILVTQELADLRAAGDGELHDQVLGNLDALVAHRQNVPESAETIASIAGTTPVWITTQQTTTSIFPTIETGQGTRTRGHEYNIHPTTIKQLPTGHAVVITPGRNQKPTVARIHHPDEAVIARYRHR